MCYDDKLVKPNRLMKSETIFPTRKLSCGTATTAVRVPVTYREQGNIYKPAQAHQRRQVMRMRSDGRIYFGINRHDVYRPFETVDGRMRLICAEPHIIEAIVPAQAVLALWQTVFGVEVLDAIMSSGLAETAVLLAG